MTRTSMAPIAQESRGKKQNALDQCEQRTDADADQTKRQSDQQDDRCKNEYDQGKRPCDREENAPCDNEYQQFHKTLPVNGESILRPNA